ncbi:MAG: hypothetical protein LBV69_08950 [Bacteroidales bacterium]|jgi:hypothetical protein|nr:hypothetical protein [Bacteroidales bacterium]
MNANKINFNKIMISFLFITIFSSCERHNNKEDYRKLTYYDVIGTRYVYDDVKKYHGISEPLRFYEIKVYSYLEPTNLYSGDPIIEKYYTDENGFLTIKFPKATDKRKVSYYSFLGGPLPSFPARFVESAIDTIKLDTLWLNPSYYQ